jgi:dipeptidase E
MQVVALGGGGFSMEAGNPLLDDFVLGLSGTERPRVCFVPTASGDADHYVVRFYRAFSPARCEPSHVSLFRRGRGAPEPAEHLLEQDIVYVGGGNVTSLLGVWRAHGLDEVLRECWRRGTILCGVSAGSLCWFRSAVTAFCETRPPAPLDGIGLLPYSNCVHVDAEPGRLDAHRALVDDGMCDGYAAEDGAALHFVGDALQRVVTSRPQARAYRVTPGAVEALPSEYLGALEAVAA